MGALDKHRPPSSGPDHGDQGLRQTIQLRRIQEGYAYEASSASPPSSMPNSTHSDGDVIEGYYYTPFFDPVPRKNTKIVPHEIHVYLSKPSSGNLDRIDGKALRRFDAQKQVHPGASTNGALRAANTLTAREQMIKNQKYVANSILAYDKSAPVSDGKDLPIIRLHTASDIWNTYYVNKKGVDKEFVPFQPGDCSAPH
jgi:hypothetical protein